MHDADKPVLRWGIHVLVGVTVLLCLGTLGYTGQVWWARRLEPDLLDLRELLHVGFGGDGPGIDFKRIILDDWKTVPWYGCMSSYPGTHVWIPRRTYYEAMLRETGLHLPNDPAAWDAWVKAHPNAVWDDQQKRLLDKAN